MGDEGLTAVENPSEMFLSERSSSPGVSSAVTVTLEGTRPLLLEVQALCSPTHQVRFDRTLATLGQLLPALCQHLSVSRSTVDCFQSWRC